MFFSGFQTEAEPIQTFGYKGFLGKNYNNSPAYVKESVHYKPDDYRRKALFHAQGVEQNSYSGLQYGSGRDYTRRTGSSDIHHATELPVRRKEEDQLDYQYPWSRERERPNAVYKKDRPIDAAVTDDSYNPFGRSGGGAPVKTISGRCIAARTIAPDIRFQKQLKKVVEQGLRYKNNDVSTPTNAMTRTPSELEKRETERRKKEIYAMKLEQQRVESQEAKHRMERENKVKGHQYNPWGRDIPQRDEDGMIQRRRREIDLKGVVNGNRAGQDQCWLRGLGGGVVNRPRRRVDTSGDHQGYDPWGRPGGGAPITSENGQIMTTVRGNFSHRKEESGSSPTEHGTSVAEWMRCPKIPVQAKGMPRKATPNMTTPTPDDVPSVEIRDPGTVLLQEAQVRHRKQEREREERGGREGEGYNEMYRPLITTRSPGKHQKASEQQQYSDELQQMIQHKQHQQRRDRERQCERENKHMTAFNQMWGRPGGGAPRVKEDKLDVSPRSYGTLNTFMTHTGQHKYRRS